MPRAIKRCAQPGCKLKAPCPKHKVWQPSSGTRPLPSNWKTIKKDARGFAAKTCYLCKTKDPGGQVDHIKNRASGGSDRPENLAWICRSCHKDKTEREKQAGRKRLKE